MTPKKSAVKQSRTTQAQVPDQKTLSTGEHPVGETSSAGRKTWKKKSAAEHILGQLDKLREEVAEKEREYLVAKKQLDKLERVREVFENE